MSFHVSGSRMIAEGGDGGSGRSLRGVMAEGQSGLHPLHLSTLNEEPTLEAWVRSWWDEKRGPSHHSPGRKGVGFEEERQDREHGFPPSGCRREVVVEQVIG
jgi:hypothetical protein